MSGDRVSWRPRLGNTILRTVWRENANTRSERLRRSPFRRSLMRWHELVFIILFSLFASLAASLEFTLDGSWPLFFANASLFCCALGEFNVYRVMEENWREVTMKEDSEPPIDRYYQEFNKDEERHLWLSFAFSASFFVAYVILKIAG